MSPPTVLRLTSRRTAGEVQSPQELVDLLFTDRLGGHDRLSVYVIPPEKPNIDRVSAEHVANIPIGAGHRGAVDITDLYRSACLAAPDNGFFQYRREAHHEIMFGTSTTDVEAAANALLPVFGNRFHSVHKNEIIRYGREQYRAKDPEWLNVCQAYTKTAEWAAK